MPFWLICILTGSAIGNKKRDRELEECREKLGLPTRDKSQDLSPETILILAPCMFAVFCLILWLVLR